MNRPRYVLALDGGGSKTEAELRTADGVVLARGRGGPANLFRDRDGAFAVIEALWRECCAGAGLEAGAARHETAISAGLAGVSAAGAPEAFHAAFTGFEAAFLCSDAFVALLGGFEGAPGILLSVGTGTVACARDAEGRFRRIGGWGFPAGDRGGGALIGLELVTAWLEHRDGVAPEPGAAALWDLLDARIGRDRATILGWMREAGPAGYATLMPLVVEAATVGNRFAGALLDRAAEHLARLAQALRRTAEVPVLVAGGLAPAMLPRLERLLGAEVLARGREQAPLHGAWLVGCGRFAAEFPAPPDRYSPGTGPAGDARGGAGRRIDGAGSGPSASFPLAEPAERDGHQGNAA